MPDLSIKPVRCPYCQDDTISLILNRKVDILIPSKNGHNNIDEIDIVQCSKCGTVLHIIDAHKVVKK